MVKKILLKLTLILSIVVLFLYGCNDSSNQTNKPLAKVYGKSLFLADVLEIFPKNISKTDSIQILKAYVDRWIRKQLLLNKAEENLSDVQKNVTPQLEDYRSSLLIFKYEQELIRQKLDTVIPYNEIENFYKENSSNFLLGETIVKALFLKLRIDDQNYDKFKNIYKSTKEDDIKTIDKLAYQTAIKYDFFNDKWIAFDKIIRELPQPISNPEAFLGSNKNFEMKDENFIYLINVRDVKFKGQQSPLEYEQQNVQSILLNKRKQKLIADLEAKIYNDALNHNHFTIFIE